MVLGFWTGTAKSDPSLTTAIAPQPLAAALTDFAHQTGLQLVYVSQIAAGRTSKDARASLSATEALTQLLEGTGLSFQFLNARTVRIFESVTVAPTAYSTTAANSRNADRADNSPPGELEEIVVTGSRGEERLSKMPFSMAVWTPEGIEMSGAKSFEAIAALTPGVEYDFDTAVGPGIVTNISIRGINDADGRSTTRLFIDGAPIHSLQSDFGEARPLLFDLERVEILRGPQGALLGEGTEGGAVRFVLRQPSLTTFSGETRAAIESTEHGGLSYEGGAAAGGPLIPDTLGFRASAWYRRDGGYVNHVDPLTGALVDADSNWSLSKAARVAVTYAPADSVRITPSLSYQSVGLNDSPIFYVNLSNPNEGVLRNGKLLKQPSEDSFSLASINAQADLPFAHLTSVSAYFRRTATALVDYTNSYPNYFLNQFGTIIPVYPVAYDNAAGFTHQLTVNEWTEELRLRSPTSEARLTWVAGLAYSNVHQRDLQALAGNVPVFFGEADPLERRGATINSHASETETGAFGELNYRFSPRFSANVGLRITHDYDRQTKVDTGYPFYLAPSLPPSTTDNPVAPKAAVSFQASEHSLYYVSATKGYRRAGIDPPLPFPCAVDLVPTSFPADSVWSYEVGAKNALLGGRMQVDFSLYQMQWQHLHQLLLSRTSCYTVPNDDAAVSHGFDLGVRASITADLKADLSVAYTHSYFTQTTQLTYLEEWVVIYNGASIGTLPQVPSPWNITAALTYDVALASGVRASLRIQDVLHTHNPGPFSTKAVSQSCCQQAPPYPPPPWPWSVENDPESDPTTNVVSVHARFSRAAVDVTLSVDNVLNSQPLLQRKSEGSFDGFVYGPPLVYATTLRPRTVGLSVGTRF
jgi:outer membrane receptor protein involved in Fe transport